MTTDDSRPTEIFSRLSLLADRPSARDAVVAEDAELGLAALSSPHDPQPSLRLVGGTVVELDSRAREEFDVVDAYIADHGLDLANAPEAMALPTLEIARMMLDPGLTREQIVSLTAGLTPARLAQVVREIRPAEVPVALLKLRLRRDPVAQAQVSNRLDDPLLLAADAATAVAYGFRELATTGAVGTDAPSNAVAVLIGAQVGAAGVLTSCAAGAGAQVRLGSRGLTSTAEAIPLPSAETGLDLDDTPWSTTFLLAAYASRGVKTRLQADAGAHALAGQSQGRSMLYLQARAACLARACGAQGLRTGGGASSALAAALPGGLLHLQYETLLATMLGLECCAGQDGAVSHAEGRRGSRTLPSLLSGADVLGGLGVVPRYDNMFGPSNVNAEELEDLLLAQRDWGVETGLGTPSESELLAVRRLAADACRAVYSWLGLADFSDEHLEAAVHAAGSRELPADIGLAVIAAARTIDQQGVTGLDIATALEETGFSEEAERLLGLLRGRLDGAQLQPGAAFDADDHGPLRPGLVGNDYSGPGTGHTADRRRLEAVNAVRGQRSTIDIRAEQLGATRPDTLVSAGPAYRSDDPRDVVIGVSPAFGVSIWTTLAGLNALDVLDELLAGLEEEGCRGRVVRIGSSAELSRIGYAAAALSGSGVALAVSGRGEVLATRRGMSPAEHLESPPTSPLIDPATYRQFGVNAARYAKGSVPQLIRGRNEEPEISAGYLGRVVSYVALEQQALVPGSAPELLEVARD